MTTVFTSKLSIHVTARSETERNRWVAIFRRLLGCFNQIETTGGWIGNKVVETEPDAVLTVWLADNDWAKIARVLKYTQWYQKVAKQEAVAIEAVVGQYWRAFVIFEGDWDGVTEELHYFLDDEYRFEKTTLARFTRK